MTPIPHPATIVPRREGAPEARERAYADLLAAEAVLFWIDQGVSLATVRAALRISPDASWVNVRTHLASWHRNRARIIRETADKMLSGTGAIHRAVDSIAGPSTRPGGKIVRMKTMKRAA